MKRIILTQQGNDILGSDGLLYVDGRFNIESIKRQVIERNARYSKNFPYKIADGFYIAGERLARISPIFTI